jgi:hypothetical protein
VNDIDSMAQDILPVQDFISRGMSSGSGVGPVRERLAQLGLVRSSANSPSTE